MEMNLTIIQDNEWIRWRLSETHTFITRSSFRSIEAALRDCNNIMKMWSLTVKSIKIENENEEK